MDGDEKVIDACRCLQVMMRLSLRWRWMKDASSACPLAPVVTGLGLRVKPFWPVKRSEDTLNA